MDIRETTLDRFGPDLGEHLLANNAILPTLDKKPAPGIRNHTAGVDLTQQYGRFNGLAVINGSRSGILVVDLDTLDLTPPAPFNVRTAKGGHVYTEWAGQARKIGIAPGVDLLGEGGYAEFVGPGKNFRSSALADQATVLAWLSALPSSPMKRLEGESSGRESKELVYGDSLGREYETPYPERVALYGFELRVETISKRYATAMRSTPPGVRNDRLYRYGLEVIRCGADLRLFAQAALDAGLPWEEVERTLVSAQATLDMDLSPDKEMLFRVQRWMDYHSGLPDVMSSVATLLAFEAVACNTSRPLLSHMKAAAELKIHRTYVGKTLGFMETKYSAVRKHPNQGTWGGGMKHANNYALTIEGEEV